jgi:hypothetical protein
MSNWGQGGYPQQMGGYAAQAGQYGQAAYGQAAEYGAPIYDAAGNIIGQVGQGMQAGAQAAQAYGAQAMYGAGDAMQQGAMYAQQGAVYAQQGGAAVMGAAQQGGAFAQQAMQQGGMYAQQGGAAMMGAAHQAGDYAQQGAMYAQQGGAAMMGAAQQGAMYAQQGVQGAGAYAQQAGGAIRDVAGDAGAYAQQAGGAIRGVAGDAGAYAQQAGGAIRGVAGDAGAYAQQAGGAIRDVAGDAGAYAQQAGGAIRGVAGDAGAYAQQAGGAIRDVAGDAGAYAQQAGGAIRGVAGDAGAYAQQAGGAIRDVAGDAGAYAQQAGGAIRGVAGDAGAYAQQAGGAIRGVAGDAGAYAQQAGGAIRDVAGDAGAYAQQAGGAISSVAGEAGTALSGAAATAGGAIRNATGEASEALSGAASLVAPTFQRVGAEAAGAAQAAKVVVQQAAGSAGVWGAEATRFSAAALQNAGKLTQDAAGQTLAELRKVTADAPQYTAMALASASRATQAARSGAGDAAKAVGGAAAQGFAYLADHKDEAAAFAASGFSYVHAGLKAGTAMVPWGQLKDIYGSASGDVVAAAAAMAGIARAGVDWVKFDIIRDFFQTVSLFFATIGSAVMTSAKTVWGNVSNAISFDINFIVPSIPPYVIYAILGALAVLMLILFIFFTRFALRDTADEIRQGNEAKTWDKLKKERGNYVLFLKYTLIALVSAYLPVSRVCIQILACETSMAKTIRSIGITDAIPCTNGTLPDSGLYTEYYTCDCNAWKPYGALAAGAVILLAVYTVGFPFFAYRIIQRNVPSGSREDPTRRFNADGVMVEYTDKMYVHDLTHDPRQQSNPFLVLYNGYERRWCFYKVVQMVFKLAIMVPVLVLWNKVVIQSAVTLVILAAFFTFASISRPFVSRVSDTMDLAGRITAFLTVLFGLIGAPGVSPSAAPVMGVLVNVANAINAVIMVWGSLYGIKTIRNMTRGFIGILRFTNTVEDISGPFERIVASPPGWDLRLEVKHRIWHAFWRALFVKGYRKECPRLGDRMVELERITADVGRYKIVDHFAALLFPGRGALRAWIADELEGTDVFWDGTSHDGHLDSRTSFGKMYIMPYPFHCVMVYDDSDDYTFLWERQLDTLVARNVDPEVQRRRGVRKSLRALEGELVYCPFQRMETHTVEDGTESYKDSNGKTHHRTRHSSVQVLMSYTNGRVHVAQNAKSKDEFGAGFTVTATFADGHGTARAPHTGQMKHITATATLGASELDIGPDYAVVGKLATILGHPQNSGIVRVSKGGG